jgi:hypothetical protein
LITLTALFATTALVTKVMGCVEPSKCGAPAAAAVWLKMLVPVEFSDINDKLSE